MYPKSLKYFTYVDGLINIIVKRKNLLHLLLVGIFIQIVRQPSSLPYLHLIFFSFCQVYKTKAQKKKKREKDDILVQRIQIQYQ